MPAITATAPGKIILFGEHAVVYGRPAVAIPVAQVRARAVVMPAPLSPPGQVLIEAPDLNLDSRLENLPEDHPLGLAVRQVLNHLGIARPPACTIRVSSTIPIAAGLGSGAAITAALSRALAEFLGEQLPDSIVSALAFEVDKLYHGTPSGIDNTVIAYGMPVFFIRQQPIELLQVPAPFTVVIGDTGIRSPTAVPVGELRQRWQLNPAEIEPLFDAIGQIAVEARYLIEAGQPEQLGVLMNDNHAFLQELGVSSPELDLLVESALQAGARGAKLSGAGKGGNMIALVDDEMAEAVASRLRANGAVRTMITTVSGGNP
jgi:mevalonate kinase